MKASSAARLIIKKYEGLSTKAYYCPAGVLTIGYGHTGSLNGKRLSPDDIITPDFAETLLAQDLVSTENALTHALDADNISLTQNQFDALISFAYNLGIHALVTSTMWKLLANGDFTGAAKQFDRWIYSRGIKLKGLITRRAEERSLFERD